MTLSRILIFLSMSWGLLNSCASSNVQTRKTPGADLWMYHTYSWRSQNLANNSTETGRQAKDRADVALTEQGFTPVSETGNPDFWVLQQITPQSISFEFVDARTGATYWKGQSTLSTNGINSAVDHLIDEYVAAQNWMPASFWWKGIDLGKE